MLPLQGAQAAGDGKGGASPQERGALGPRLPPPLARAGAEVGRGRPPALPLPAPLLSSRQAAIGLLLHDCPLHRVPETLLPAAIFKIPPARPRSLSAHGEGSSSYHSVPAAATTEPAGGPGPRTHPRGVARCPLGPSGPRCPSSPIGRGSSWGRACQWRQGSRGTYAQTHLVGFVVPALVLCCPKPRCPHLCSNRPLPTSPIPCYPWGGQTAGPGLCLWLPGAHEAGRRSIH